MVKNAELDEVKGEVYEIGYLLVPSLPAERIPEEAGRMRELVEKYGGTLIAEEDPKLRELSYPMQRMISHKRETFASAYFGWVKFKARKEEMLVFRKIFLRGDYLFLSSFALHPSQKRAIEGYSLL